MNNFLIRNALAFRNQSVVLQAASFQASPTPISFRDYRLDKATPLGLWFHGMLWTIPQFSRNQVNKAGTILNDPTASGEAAQWAFTVISNWRSSHNFPLNTFQNTLRRNTKLIDKSGLIAQRIKRLPAIKLKLRDNPLMKLSQMQDIGGCRAVVGNVSSVDRLAEISKQSWRKHEFIEKYDYIRHPKSSGYRSLHLVYRYYSKKSTAHNGLRIEVQLRSQLQHIWATAVEVLGTFTQQALKSSHGEHDWLRFFSLMGTAIAIREGTETVPGTPTDEIELKKQLSELMHALKVEERLRAFTAVFEPPLDIEQGIKEKRYHYFLLNLNYKDRRISLTAYHRQNLNQASSDYFNAERQASGSADIVLVSVDSLAALKRAYPNYFLDTNRFLAVVAQTMSR